MGSRVVIVQHGEKEREPGDPGLTPSGRAQARVTARFVAERFAPSAVWSSPLRRAVETAAPLAESVGVEVRIDPRLRERMNWDGDEQQSLEEFLGEWHQATEDRSFVPRSGDSSESAARRFIEAIDAIATAGSGTVAVVAHGGVTVDTLRTIAGDEAVRDQRPELLADGVPCGAVTILDRISDRWRLIDLPSTDHLDATVDHRPA